jgi:hypothetical protein
MKFSFAVIRSRCTELTAATARIPIRTPKKKTAFGASAKHSKRKKLLTARVCFPFAFSLNPENYIAYNFFRNLSTIVYARPGGHADLYLLSQK